MHTGQQWARGLHYVRSPVVPFSPYHQLSFERWVFRRWSLGLCWNPFFCLTANLQCFAFLGAEGPCHADSQSPLQDRQCLLDPSALLLWGFFTAGNRDSLVAVAGNCGEHTHRFVQLLRPPRTNDHPKDFSEAGILCSALRPPLIVCSNAAGVDCKVSADRVLSPSAPFLLHFNSRVRLLVHIESHNLVPRNRLCAARDIIGSHLWANLRNRCGYRSLLFWREDATYSPTWPSWCALRGPVLTLRWRFGRFFHDSPGTRRRTVRICVPAQKKSKSMWGPNTATASAIHPCASGPGRSVGVRYPNPNLPAPQGHLRPTN